MPLNKLRLDDYTAPVFVETGTWRGHGVKRAQAAGFETIYSVEYDKKLYTKACKLFKGQKNVHLFSGESMSMLRAVVPALTRCTTFWLDAHPEGALSLDRNVVGRNYAPLLEELEFIISHVKHVPTPNILLDDMRLFSPEDIARLRTVAETVGRITFADGVVKDDVMVVQC